MISRVLRVLGIQAAYEKVSSDSEQKLAFRKWIMSELYTNNELLTTKFSPRKINENNGLMIYLIPGYEDCSFHGPERRALEL